MLKKMGEAVARVARKVNETVESGSDTLDLAECKLVSFPIGIYKVLRNVTDQIHLITLANNELKSLTSKFMTTFCQLRELHLEGNFLHRLPNEVSTLRHLQAIDLSRNQFRDFPEQLTTLPALETINLEENNIVGEPSQPPNSSWPPSQNGSHTKATPTVNLTFSSYYQHSSPVAALFIVAYVLIFLLCMVGNALVCFIVLKNRHMRTVTNMFILNLAVSDLLVGIFCMPTTLVDNLITGECRPWRQWESPLPPKALLAWSLGQDVIVSNSPFLWLRDWVRNNRYNELQFFSWFQE
uniref:Leucine rich repeat containing 20 n=1 Tax=Canis lupus familiaris TaxID=9615 RepID=A0A8C0QH17_CANLF